MADTAGSSTGLTTRAHFLHWRNRELFYADQKFDGQREKHDEEMKKDQVSDHSFWMRQMFQYIDRVRIFGLETLQGRQALAKFYMTAGGCVESAIRVFGELPKPGVPSGYIEPWDDERDKG